MIVENYDIQIPEPDPPVQYCEVTMEYNDHYINQRRVVFGPYQVPEHPEWEGQFVLPSGEIVPLVNVYDYAKQMGLLPVAKLVTVTVRYNPEDGDAS